MDPLSKMSKHTLPVMMPKHISPLKNMKSVELKVKSCYSLIKKNSVDKEFLNSIKVNESEEQKRQGENEKLKEILFKVNQYIEK